MKLKQVGASVRLGITIMISILASFSLAGCADIFKLFGVPLVYVAGDYVAGDKSNWWHAACYWLNGIRFDLSPNGESANASSIYVSDGTVYTGGGYYDGTTNVACYWTNNVRTRLPGGIAPFGAFAYAIYVSDGTVYTAGSYFNGSTGAIPPNVACYWANDVKIDLPGGTGYEAKSIFVSEGKVYVAGGSCYWKDGIKINLPNADAFESIYVADGKVYIGGNGGYWIDGVKTELSGWINSIFVSGGKVYAAGRNQDGTACYWVDGERTDLSNAGLNSGAVSIYEKDGIVYVAGNYGETNTGFYFANGVMTALSEKEAYASLDSHVSRSH